MKRVLVVLTAGALLWSVTMCDAFAQKGMGERVGVASQAVKPEVVAVSGKVLKINTEPCKTTTGPSVLGTHVLLKTPQGKELNIHLGPADRVGYATEKLPVGETVTASVFRTAKMPENHYVAQSVTSKGNAIQLRDDNLRPRWAGSTALRGRSNAQWGSPRGRGRTGEGRWSRGRRSGRGQGQRWRW